MKYRSVPVVAALLAAAGCDHPTGPSATTTETFSTATSVITDSVATPDIVCPDGPWNESGTLARARSDVNTGSAKLTIDGNSATLLFIQRCPVCSRDVTNLWTGRVLGGQLELTGTEPDPHAGGCHVYEHVVSMSMRLYRTADGWAGYRLNYYDLQDDTTRQPVSVTVLDTLMVEIK